MPLKGVIIIGAGIGREIGDYGLSEGYLVIGDGKSLISPEEIIRKVREHGGVDSSTRWDIRAHGMAPSWYKGDLVTKNIHTSDVFPRFVGSTTSRILDVISQLQDGKPTEVHLWSCYGGSAARDANRLPRGSCVIAHAPKNRTSSLSYNYKVSKILIRKREARKFEKDVLNYSNILTDLPYGTGEKCVVGISGIDHTISHTFSGAKKYTDLQIQLLNRRFIEDVHKAVRVASVGIRHIKTPIVPPAILLTEEEIGEFRSRRIRYEGMHGRPKFMRFLKDPENLDYIINQLLSKDGEDLAVRMVSGETWKYSYEVILDSANPDIIKKLIYARDREGSVGFLFADDPEKMQKFLSLAKSYGGDDIWDVIAANNSRGENILSSAIFFSAGENQDRSISAIESAFSQEHIKQMLVTAKINDFFSSDGYSDEQTTSSVAKIAELSAKYDVPLKEIFKNKLPETYPFEAQRGDSVLHTTIIDRTRLQKMFEYMEGFSAEEKAEIYDEFCKANSSGITPISRMIKLGGNLESLPLLVENLGHDRIIGMISENREQIQKLTSGSPKSLASFQAICSNVGIDPAALAARASEASMVAAAGSSGTSASLGESGAAAKTGVVASSIRGALSSMAPRVETVTSVKQESAIHRK